MTDHPNTDRAPGSVRRESRAPTRCPVTVRTMRETTHGLVLDISPSGARLYMDGLIDCGHEILLNLLGHEAFAVVVWSRQYECGVRFPRPLEPELLAQISAALTSTDPVTEQVAIEEEPEPEPAAPTPTRAASSFGSLSASTIVRGRRRAF